MTSLQTIEATSHPYYLELTGEVKLSRKEGITPNEATQNKLQPEAIIGLFLRLIEK